MFGKHIGRLCRSRNFNFYYIRNAGRLYDSRRGYRVFRHFLSIGDSFKKEREMRKRLLFCGLLAIFVLSFVSCAKEKEYKLNESTFFLVMTNMQYYPEQYLNKNIEFDCFTYDLTDVDGNVYRCGVRKCSSGYGCKCGKDTVIGFLLRYDGSLPEPKNQSEDTNDKSWIHLSGTLTSTEKTKITVYAYNADGSINKNSTEIIEFLTFDVSEVSVISDYSGLNYYVTK